MIDSRLWHSLSNTSDITLFHFIKKPYLIVDHYLKGLKSGFFQLFYVPCLSNEYVCSTYFHLNENDVIYTSSRFFLWQCDHRSCDQCAYRMTDLRATSRLGSSLNHKKLNTDLKRVVCSCGELLKKLQLKVSVAKVAT